MTTQSECKWKSTSSSLTTNNMVIADCLASSSNGRQNVFLECLYPFWYFCNIFYTYFKVCRLNSKLSWKENIIVRPFTYAIMIAVVRVFFVLVFVTSAHYGSRHHHHDKSSVSCIITKKRIRSIKEVITVTVSLSQSWWTWEKAVREKITVNLRCYRG